MVQILDSLRVGGGLLPQGLMWNWMMVRGGWILRGVGLASWPICLRVAVLRMAMWVTEVQSFFPDQVFVVAAVDHRVDFTA
jgi:hypothetical protein